MILIIRIKRETYAAISRQHKIFSKIVERARRAKPVITSQNASYTGQAHSRRRKCKNHPNLSTLQIVKYQIRTHWHHVVYSRCGDQ